MAKLGKALMSLLLDKRAREKLAARKAAPQRAPAPGTDDGAEAGAEAQPAPPSPPRHADAPHPSREELYARLNDAAQASDRRAASPDRQRLIQDALKVRAQQAKKLDELPREQRLKLQAMAQLSFLKARGDGGG